MRACGPAALVGGRVKDLVVGGSSRRWSRPVWRSGGERCDRVGEHLVVVRDEHVALCGDLGDQELAERVRVKARALLVGVTHVNSGGADR